MGINLEVDALAHHSLLPKMHLFSVSRLLLLVTCKTINKPKN